MDKYAQADARLAKLLGWREIIPPARPKSYIHIDPEGKLHKTAPRWTSDSTACLDLIAEHDVELIPSDGSHCAAVTLQPDARTVSAASMHCDHANKATAIRYAAVAAVIAKLEFILEAEPEEKAEAARKSSPGLGA